ncbi:microsomal glutathione S-transferase 1 [Cataglyphis hispanica]|uniref:microsomal glutathione S-transferase 1 n=1 Tax=Cataglyphis hispanica TaxID=1086592 RepID=UPI00217FC372|nr:microsomal glutathione S-transferase 1 [Cataglyphis hispanica]XP_050450385.1 microsomal glutathione S-transferase 1 [Cataglyphis hispanica]
MAEISSELLQIFGFWGSILVLKMLAMLPLTVRQRFRKKVFMNEEDAALTDGSKVTYNDPDVERVRRAHLNDLENILPWFAITYLWLGTGPSSWLAKMLIRTFVLARIFHTISYVIMKQQPTRAIVFFVGFAITFYQALSTLLHYS